MSALIRTLNSLRGRTSLIFVLHPSQEVIVDASVTQYNLTRLYPASKYTVQLQAETGGRYSAAIVTDFTTGNEICSRVALLSCDSLVRS